ncbi:CoA transferase [Polaromonas naphthalenivorans]|uniref:L-carnitine dehydratase/bile acid-inducible protein F n=1 Tax=Polaromonas naphthalenivorans (strain CJ2) TaxID=365044 RepID=A1VNI2_POLNA|nr:CoA transferase [Polaromonas naphthalenivorans]ABM37210.1 L-carnitine dehydratase/bile acid-inducible protein F [Polaromonas naphthalenivorans CJ2]
MTTTTAPAIQPVQPFQPLQGIRILSLALNLPGPAALMRLSQMGAACIKLEPPAGDPMQQYNQAAYRQLHENIEMLTADLKTEAGQQQLHRELAQADVLITSFRPSALVKLGLTWQALHRQHPQLSQIAIFGAPGERAEEAGHDLTYVAESGLVTGLDLPATLYADMGGSLMTSEAVLQAVMHQRSQGEGVYLEIALSSAAGYLALPRAWGLTQPGAAIGGGHAGYRVYPCQDGRVALAALEPHFALRLCAAAGISMPGIQTMLEPATHEAVAAFLLTYTREQLDALAVEKDIPLCTLGN